MIYRYGCECGKGAIYSVNGPKYYTAERLAVAQCRYCEGQLKYKKARRHNIRNSSFTFDMYDPYTRFIAPEVLASQEGVPGDYPVYLPLTDTEVEE